MNSNRPLRDAVPQWLMDLEALIGRWQAWLADSERDLVSGKIDQLQLRLSEGEQLQADALQLDQHRHHLLGQARGDGCTASRIGELFDFLSVSPDSSRQRLENAQWHLRQLRSEQMALWIGFSQAADLAHSSLQILATGRSAPCTYGVSEGEALAGGQLVDAEA